MSNVSILYFSRAYAWHVCVCITVSCVQNQAMYTLWWMNCKMGYMGNEHEKCSFCIGSSIHHVYAIWNVHVVVCSLWDSYPCPLWLSCDMCDIRVISTMMLRTWFLYIEEFSISPCPTCPTYQSYILVGLSADTFVDTIPCQVSKIGACIRYDGWCAKLRYGWNEHIWCSFWLWCAFSVAYCVS